MPDEPGWLQRELANATAEVQTWPAWLRQAAAWERRYQAARAGTAPPPSRIPSPALHVG